MGKILFNSLSENMHTLWKSLVDNPPENYEFVVSYPKLDINKLSSFKKNKIVRILYKNIFSKFITPFSLSAKFIEIPEDIDLIYCPDRYTTKKFPWVCDAEEAIVFAGHNADFLKRDRKKIEAVLSSDYCKKIMAFTNFAKESIEREFDSLAIKNKIEVVHFAADVPKPVKKKCDNKINIIFVGTANNKDPMIFNLKGGREIIEAFKLINKKYKNVNLKIISNIPEGTDTNVENLEIIPLMERDKLFKIYAESDIFLFPNYFGLGMTVVEAMGSGLAMVCSDMFGLPDAIDEGKNGLVVKMKNKGIYEFRGPSISEFNELMNFIYENNHKDTVNQIVKHLTTLIENPKLIKKMGEESRKKYEKGFSVEARNKKLKKIFDEVLSR